MSIRPGPPSTDATLGDHEARLRDLEGAAMHGPWRNVGDGNPEEPEFENDFANPAGLKTRFRRLGARGVQWDIWLANTPTPVPGTTVCTVIEKYWPDQDTPIVGSEGTGGVADFLFQTDGQLVFVGSASIGY